MFSCVQTTCWPTFVNRCSQIYPSASYPSASSPPLITSSVSTDQRPARLYSSASDPSASCPVLITSLISFVIVSCAHHLISHPSCSPTFIMTEIMVDIVHTFITCVSNIVETCKTEIVRFNAMLCVFFLKLKYRLQPL